MDQLTREAMYWTPLDDVADGTVRCDLCPHHCIIEVGKRGLCRSRFNRAGKLYAQNYGQAISLSIDPIEKKPLYHYYPGSQILSTGPNSCNLSCFFCQNYTVSQQECPSTWLSFEALEEYFELHPKLPRRLAITYTEPITWYEYIMDLSERLPDLRIVLITNGYIEAEPLEALLPRIDAMNIDLKSIREDFYRQACGGSQAPVLHTISRADHEGVHVEITNLLIPGLNDSEEDIVQLAKTIARINWEIPLHFSAYHPAYKSSIPATNPESVLKARDLALEHLRWVYAGNIGPGEFCDTYCDKCLEHLISRKPGHSWCDVAFDDYPICPTCLEPIWGRFEV